MAARRSVNPVKITNKTCTWWSGIFMLFALFVLSIAIVAQAGSAISSSCTIYRGILPLQPVWMFLYYRFYSSLLCNILDCCCCCKHRMCYAFWNYAIWGTIGHPIVCLGPFAYYTVRGTIDLFEDSTCTRSVDITSSQITIWEVGLSAYCVLA